MGGGVAIVDESSAEGAGDIAVLPFGPDAHQEFDVVQGPGAALKVAVGPVKLLGIGSVHSYITLMVLVEISSDPDDVFGTARMESKA